MDTDQINLVQGSWSKVLPIAETAADLFYTRLFEIDPSTKVLFKGDIKEQGRKLMQMITAAVKGLNDLDGRPCGTRNWAAATAVTASRKPTTARWPPRCCGQWNRAWATTSHLR